LSANVNDVSSQAASVVRPSVSVDDVWSSEVAEGVRSSEEAEDCRSSEGSFEAADDFRSDGRHKSFSSVVAC
jgi:hypothetical protein